MFLVLSCSFLQDEHLFSKLRSLQLSQILSSGLIGSSVRFRHQSFPHIKQYLAMYTRFLNIPTTITIEVIFLRIHVTEI